MEYKQNCECEGCLATNVESSYYSKKEDFECIVCYDVKEEIAVMEKCSHVVCSPCMRAWRSLQKYCPCCRQKSNMAIYSNQIFMGQEKESLFSRHRICILRSDSILMNFLEDLNSAWKYLIELVLSRSVPGACEGLTMFNIGPYASLNKSEIAHTSDFHASLKNSSGKARVVICCQMIGFSWQVVLLSSEQARIAGVSCRYDDDHADSVIVAFQEQLTSSWKDLLFHLNPDHQDFILVRQFNKMSCALYLAKDSSRPQAELTENGPVRNLLWTLNSHNVIFDHDYQKRSSDYISVLKCSLFPRKKQQYAR